MADRWYETGYDGSASSGKTLKLHIYTISHNIAQNESTERADLYMSVTNTVGGWWNNYGSPAYIGINGNNTTQNVTFDARNYGDRLLIGSWDTVIQHDDDGRKTIGISASHNTNVGLGYAYLENTYECDTIPRASTVTLSKNRINIGESVEIRINRKSNKFKHAIRFSYYDQNPVLANNVDTSFTWNTQENEELLYSKIPNENSSWGTIIVETYDGNTRIGSNNARIDVNVVNANPIFNNFTFKDINTKTVALTGSNQKIISGYSNIEATISMANKAIAQKQAIMTKYRLQIGTQQTDADYSDTEDISMVLNNVDNNVIRVYAIDSRGNTTSKDLSPTAFLQYTNIKITNSNVTRDSGGVSQKVTININGEFWNNNFGTKTNTIKSLKIQYKRTDNSTWINGDTLTPTINGNNFSVNTLIKGDLGVNGFDTNYSYDIKVIVEDELSTFTTILTLGSGKPAIAIHRKGVAFGSPYDEYLGGLVQIDGKKIFDSNQNCIKFSDGIMIEFKTKTNISFTGADYYGFCNRSGPIEITFENTFIGETPIIIPTTGTFGAFSINIVSVELNKFSTRIFYPSKLNLDKVNISYIAIGRWKMAETTIIKNILPTDVNSWEIGTLRLDTGLPMENAARLRTKDFVPLESLGVYYCIIQNSNYSFVNVQYYNSNKQRITSANHISEINNHQTAEIVIPQNTAYIKVVVRRKDGNNISLSEFDNIKPIIAKKY